MVGSGLPGGCGRVVGGPSFQEGMKMMMHWIKQADMRIALEEAQSIHERVPFGGEHYTVYMSAGY